MRRLLALAIAVALALVVALPAGAGNGRNFRTHLSGAEEVPAVDTKAQGQAIFKVSKDGQSIQYKLIVANIENVVMAHIHVAARGENGGIVVWLLPDSAPVPFPPPPPAIPGRSDGVVAQGVFTADDLVGSLAGEDLETLVELMNDGMTYVNVHTVQFGGGEIRGQIG